MPANSFIATAEAVSLVGAVPRFADVEPDTQLVSAATIEPALTPAVRCVIPVHLYGRTVEMEPIVQLASRRGLRVLEDAAQAHGARYRGRRVGAHRRRRHVLLLPGQEPRSMGRRRRGRLARRRARRARAAVALAWREPALSPPHGRHDRPTRRDPGGGPEREASQAGALERRPQARRRGPARRPCEARASSLRSHLQPAATTSTTSSSCVPASATR